MKLRFFTISTIFLFLLSINLAFSVGSCCYDPNNRGIHFWFADTCEDGETRVGDPQGGAICEPYIEKQLGCERNSICYESYFGKKLYDIPEVLNNYDFGDCEQPYRLIGDIGTCGGNFGAGINIGDGGGNVGVGDTPDGSVVGDGQDPGYGFDDGGTITPQRDLDFCGNAGNPFGFFVTKESCEGIVTGSSNSCIFNPYLGGKLNSRYTDYESLGLDFFENSCIPKTEIKECLDYKNKEICEDNPSRLVSGRTTLANNCTWVETSEFSKAVDLSYEQREGICVTNRDVTSDVYYDETEYSFRLNTLKNPSFEDGANDWDVIDPSKIIYDAFAYDRLYYYELNQGDEIVQRISNLAKDVSYSTHGHVRVNDVSAGDHIIYLEIIPYDINGNMISDKIQNTEITLDGQFSTLQGIFKKINFRSFPVEEDMDYVEFKVSSIGDIDVDAFSFEASKRNSLAITDEIFKPVEIISERASRCEECYDPLNLNLCTEEKSDILGDCSYMVNSTGQKYESLLSNYPTSENKYMDDSWLSQSIPNSKVFCEMYIDQNSCESLDNYVNQKYSSVHLLSNTSLCKWANNLGCYKDSDGDDQTDVINGSTVLRGTSQSNYDSVKPTDFELSCDPLPPNSYIYFSGKNESGDTVVISSGSYDGKVGALGINLEVSDAVQLESCEEYDFDSIIYIDYGVSNANGDNYYFRSFRSNIGLDSGLVAEYFVDNLNRSLIVDGPNTISILVRDRSGNTNKEFKYDLDIDIGGPSIVLNEPIRDEYLLISDIIGPNRNFSFTFSDTTGVGKCTFELDSDDADLSHYNPYTEIDFNSSLNIDYEFKLPISNSSVSPDFYMLNVTCSDVFEQKETELYFFRVDYRTDIVLLSPTSFESYDVRSGFLNGLTPIDAVSSERVLNQCQVSFPGYDLTSDSILKIVSIDDPDNFEVENFPGVTFYNTIAGNISFASDGKKEGFMICNDDKGNEFRENLVYYYDTVQPEVVYYDILDYFGTDTIVSLKKIGDDYYTYRNRTIGEYSVTINGTGSWFLENASRLKALNGEGSYLDVDAIFTETNLDNQTFLANIKFTPDIQFGYIEVPGEDKLLEMRFILEYFDKAGNMNEYEFNYYYDFSSLELNYGGDVNLDLDEGILFSNSENPRFNLSLNSPSYRTFSCDVTFIKDNFRYKQTFEYSSSIEFFLSELTTEKLVEGEIYGLEFECIDTYGFSFGETYEIVYDSRSPELSNFYVLGGDVYIRNSKNIQYSDIIDKLIFKLENTDEVSDYSCDYRFIDVSGNYTCDESPKNIIFTTAGSLPTEDLTIVRGSDSTGSAICSRTPEFETALTNAAYNNISIGSKILIEGICFDGAGNPSLQQQIEYGINYLVGDLVDMKFDYDKGLAFPRVRSLIRFDNVFISFQSDSYDDAFELTVVSEEDGLYVYESFSGIDLTPFESGRYPIFAHGISQDRIENTLSGTLVVDDEPPKAELIIPDMQNGNEIYSSEFLLELNGFDIDTAVSKVYLYSDGLLLFNSSNPSYFVSNFTIAHDEGASMFSDDKREFRAYVGYINAEIGDVINFEMEVYDEANNINRSFVTVNVLDGVSILIKDSTNAAKERGGLSWVTNANQPIFNFDTTKEVTSCDIYPFIEEEWAELSEEELIGNVFMGGTGPVSFSFNTADLNTFDLGSISSYDLSLLSDTISKVKVVCLYEGKYYNYTRNVKYIDFLPDYVLRSSSGFVFNEAPYETFINVKSVGPYRYISCRYGINGANYKDFLGGPGTSFNELLDLSAVPDGTNIINLECEDIIGNLGPSKEYEFIIDRNAELEITDLEFRHGNKIFAPDSNGDIYIASQNNLDLSFKLNQRNGIVCSYAINPSTNIIDGVVNFFKDLFGLSRIDIGSEAAYEYLVNDISGIPENENSFSVTCDNTLTGDSDSLSYKLIVDNSEFNVDLNRVAN